VATLTFNAEPTQSVVAAVLRPGNSPAKRGAIPLLRRLLAPPRAILRIRLEGGFASPEVFDFLEAEGVEYVVAMASNVRLAKRSRRLIGRARVPSKVSGQTAVSSSLLPATTSPPGLVIIAASWWLSRAARRGGSTANPSLARGLAYVPSGSPARGSPTGPASGRTDKLPAVPLSRQTPSDRGGGGPGSGPPDAAP